MPRLKKITKRVRSNWLEVKHGECELLVCSTDSNCFVVVPPVIGENNTPITERNVHGINVLDAQEFPDEDKAMSAAQLAVNNLQRTYIMDIDGNETRH